MDYYFDGIQRLDWGFGNPNITAALIAMIAVAVFGAGLVWRKFFWLSIIVGSVLSATLHQTLSRGGLVAFGCGFGSLFVVIRPRLGRWQSAAILAMICLLFAYANKHGGTSRYITGVNGKDDRSLSNRWLIYKVVPQMIADAPGGWGKGKAAEAYHQWYQPEGRSETYLNLVNSHFTWLVEWPFWARILYGMSWSLVLLVSWPNSKHRWWGIVLAVWMTLFVASCFSSVAHRPWIWPFPVTLLLTVIIHRLVTHQGPSRKQMLAVIFAPLAVYLAILLIAGISRSDSQIQHTNGITTVGSVAAMRKIALCGSDRRILGERYGHRIRAFVKSHADASISYFDSPATSIAGYQTAVLVGDAHEKFKVSPKCDLFLLNPSPPARSTNLQDFKSAKVLWGSLNPSPAWYAWQAKSAQNTELELIQIPGEGLFLENWLAQIK